EAVFHVFAVIVVGIEVLALLEGGGYSQRRLRNDLRLGLAQFLERRRFAVWRQRRETAQRHEHEEHSAGLAAHERPPSATVPDCRSSLLDGQTDCNQISRRTGGE